MTDSPNVELVRRRGEAANRRPKPDFDVRSALFDPNHVRVAQLSGVEGETFHGARGFRDWLANFGEAFEWLGARLRQVTEVDNDRVLVVQTVSLRSRKGDVPLEQEVASVITVREGKIVRTESYPSVGQALQALGVPEQP